MRLFSHAWSSWCPRIALKLKGRAAKRLAGRAPTPGTRARGGPRARSRPPSPPTLATRQPTRSSRALTCRYRYYNSWHQCKYDYSDEEPQCAKLKQWTRGQHRSQGGRRGGGRAHEAAVLAAAGPGAAGSCGCFRTGWGCSPRAGGEALLLRRPHDAMAPPPEWPPAQADVSPRASVRPGSACVQWSGSRTGRSSVRAVRPAAGEEWPRAAGRGWSRAGRGGGGGKSWGAGADPRGRGVASSDLAASMRVCQGGHARSTKLPRTRPPPPPHQLTPRPSTRAAAQARTRARSPARSRAATATTRRLPARDGRPRPPPPPLLPLLLLGAVRATVGRRVWCGVGGSSLVVSEARWDVGRVRRYTRARRVCCLRRPRAAAGGVCVSFTLVFPLGPRTSLHPSHRPHPIPSVRSS